MREMTKEETVLFDIIKENCEDNNYDLIRKFYKEQYNIDLPDIPYDVPTIWTVERRIRLLKQTYPNILTNANTRQIRDEMVTRYKEMALDDNKPVMVKNVTKQEQGTLGLFGESWW